MENRLELGSEFNLCLNALSIKENTLFSYLANYETAWFNYGRAAIKQISLPEAGRILLPEFICESVISCFPVDRICFYKVNARFEIVAEDLFEKINVNTALVYLVHYLGFCQDYDTLRDVRCAAERVGAIVVEDTTQSLLSNVQVVGHYCIASVRKWLPVPQGAVLYAPKGAVLPDCTQLTKSLDNRRAYGQILKDLYLSEQLDVNQKYREIFAEAEEIVDTICKPEAISDFARFVIGCSDVDEIIRKRKRNADYVKNTLKAIGMEGIRAFSDTECPLVYPIRVNHRDELRKFLIDHRIYCAVHWPFDGMQPENRQQGVDNANNLLSLPIDQRYGLKEIAYMLDILSQFRGDLIF